MTYAGFFALAEHMASHLRQSGLVKGDRAAIISENRPEWCASYLAVVMCGGIAVPIDMQLGVEEIKNLLQDSGARLVFCSSRTEPNVSGAIAGSAIKTMNFDGNDIPRQRTACFPPFLPPEQSPEDIASIIYTSGTTGNPKGVMLTHNNFCSDAVAVMGAGVVTKDDNVLSVLPLHHTYPFMCTFLVPLFLGGTITFSPGLKAPDIAASIKENGVTVVVGVPRLFETIRNGIFAKIREKGKIADILTGLARISGKLRRKFDINAGRLLFRQVHRNFGAVRFFASGGAKLDPPVMEDLESLGFTVLEGYGLTETSPVITFNPPDKRKPGSAGKPLPGVAIRIGDDGEIRVKGPMVMKGYYRNPAATAEVIKDGELLTGDIGALDHDGYLFITGRKKEVIILSSGKNVYPEDVEKAYMVTPLIKELCVVPSSRDAGGLDTADSIRAVIVPDLEYAKKASIGNITEELTWKINEASSKLPEYMRIKGYVLYPEPLPRTPLGKLRRFMVSGIIREQMQKEKPERQADTALEGDPIGKKVAESIRTLMEEDIIVHASDNLELDLGFDSLTKVEFITLLENAFSITVPDTFIAEIQTVGDVVSALRGYRGAGRIPDTGALSWREILEKEPTPEDARKIGYSHGFIELAAVFVILLALKVLFKTVFRLEVKGMENIPGEGPFVITPNHASYLDGFLIAASVPFKMFRKLYILGMRQFFTGGFKAWFARLAHVIPIDAETYLHKALQMSAYVLRSGRSLCVFPEGGRSFDGSVMPFKKGIGVLALELNATVVPAYIDGAFKALPREAKFLRPARIRVTFGKALTPSAAAPAKRTGAGDIYQSFADGLRHEVVTLSGKG